MRHPCFSLRTSDLIGWGYGTCTSRAVPLLLHVDRELTRSVGTTGMSYSDNLALLPIPAVYEHASVLQTATKLRSPLHFWQPLYCVPPREVLSR